MGRRAAAVFVLGLVMLALGLAIPASPLGAALAIGAVLLFAGVVLFVFWQAWGTKGWSWPPWRNPERDDR